jgi:phosphoserine aminotransferase
MKMNFTPGPSQLYFTVEGHLRQAIRSDIASLSHRSKEFEMIFSDTCSNLRELLGIPEGFHIFFTGSATEIWERSIQNLVLSHSLHLVNGAFSKRFYEIATQLGKKATMIEVSAGSGFVDPISIPSGTEMIAITHNETSTGVSLPLDFVHSMKERARDALIVVDAVSSLPFPSFDYSKIDSVFFSVQKGFGLPAGLGVWIVNDRCVAKAESMANTGVSIGSYHSLPTLRANQKKNQTPETPNVLGIYLLGKVVKDMLRRGIDLIRKETEYKSTLLYQALSNHPHLQAFVKEQKFQSKTVMVADCGPHLNRVSEALIKKGLYPGDGYGEFRKSQLRFANFPTHSKEQFELLVDTLENTSIV